jgi:hypothetical protein
MLDLLIRFELLYYKIQTKLMSRLNKNDQNIIKNLFFLA